MVGKASGGERFADESDRGLEVAGDERCWDAEHAVAGALEDAVPVRVEVGAGFMRATIDFDDTGRACGQTRSAMKRPMTTWRRKARPRRLPLSADHSRCSESVGW